MQNLRLPGSPRIDPLALRSASLVVSGQPDAPMQVHVENLKRLNTELIDMKLKMEDTIHDLVSKLQYEDKHPLPSSPSTPKSYQGPSRVQFFHSIRSFNTFFLMEVELIFSP